MNMILSSEDVSGWEKLGVIFGFNNKAAKKLSDSISFINKKNQENRAIVDGILETTDMSKIKVYTWNGETYLEVPEIAKLWHQKTGNDVHTEHTIAPSAYKVVIKKEFDYFAGIMRQVRD